MFHMFWPILTCTCIAQGKHLTIAMEWCQCGHVYRSVPCGYSCMQGHKCSFGCDHTCIHMYYTFSSTVQSGLDPLHCASQKGHKEVVDVLLKSGMDPNLYNLVWRLTCFSCPACVVCSSVCLNLRQGDSM